MEAMIRAVEDVSVDARDAQAAALSWAGCMQRPSATGRSDGAAGRAPRGRLLAEDFVGEEPLGRSASSTEFYARGLLQPTLK